MDELIDFLSETYDIRLNTYENTKVSQNLVLFQKQDKGKRYFLISSPLQKDIENINIFITNLANSEFTSQKVVKTQSDSEIIERESKFYSLYQFEFENSLLERQLTKTLLTELLMKIESVLSYSQKVLPLFQNADSYEVSFIEDKIKRQIEKASYYLLPKEKIQVSDYEYIRINKEVLDLSTVHLTELIEKITRDIDRDVININVDNSVYLKDGEISFAILDKIFIGDPLFVYSRLCANLIDAQSNFEYDEICNMIEDFYKSLYPSHFSIDYFTELCDIYLFIKLYRSVKLFDNTEEFKDISDIAKRLYRSKLVEWV